MGLVRRRAEAGRIPPVDTLACLRRVSPRKVKNIGGGQVGMAKRSRSPDHLSYSRLVLHVWVCPVPADRRERVPLRENAKKDPVEVFAAVLLTISSRAPCTAVRISSAPAVRQTVPWRVFGAGFPLNVLPRHKVPPDGLQQKIVFPPCLPAVRPRQRPRPPPHPSREPHRGPSSRDGPPVAGRRADSAVESAAPCGGGVPPSPWRCPGGANFPRMGRGFSTPPEPVPPGWWTGAPRALSVSKASPKGWVAAI